MVHLAYAMSQKYRGRNLEKKNFTSHSENRIKCRAVEKIKGAITGVREFHCRTTTRVLMLSPMTKEKSGGWGRD